MERFPTTRSPILAYAAFLIGYFLAVAAAVGLTRFGGGFACVWIAGALLLVALNVSDRRHWPKLVVGCWTVGTIAIGIWGVGPLAAPWMAAITVTEPIIAVLLIARWGIRRGGLDSVRNLGLFAIAAGLVAPLVTAFPAALLISIVGNVDFRTSIMRWYIAHALGTLVFTPIFLLIATGEIVRTVRTMRIAALREVLVLGAAVLAISIAVFWQSSFPLLFLPILPLMALTFRHGRIGGAAGLVVIAIVGGGFTMRGMGPVALMHASAPDTIQFFQFYLIATVMTVLPAAAELTQRSQLFEALRDSEARFRLLTEHSSDIVINLHVDGKIRYVSPSIARLGGYDPATLIGQSSTELVVEEDRARVRDSHRAALADPQKTFFVEFRGIVGAGEERWFETHTQAVVDADGVVTGVVSAIRETSERKRTEEALVAVAHTDALTGLCNRRAFDRDLDAALQTDRGGVVALFDLDHFKGINDRFGHAVGDEVIKAFAAAARAHVRDGDMLARIGGEEFGLLCPGVSIAVAERVCERIRIAVAGIDVSTDNRPIRVTVSVGIAAVGKGRDARTVLRDADAALYEAKATGRNRLWLAA